MFAHIFVTRLKCALRDRQTLFWSLLFPLLLATLFSLAFSNLNKSEAFHSIPLGIVADAQYKADAYFQSDINENSVSDNKADAMLLVSEFSTQTAADESLDNNKIAGYIVYEDGTPQLVVRQSGLQQTILAKFLEQYLQIQKTVENVAQIDHNAVPTAVKQVQEHPNMIESFSPNDAAPNDTLTYYYALIAMACLYGGFWGMKEVSDVQADQTAQGARVNLAPVHKLKVFGASLCAVILVHFSSILLLIAYLGLVIGIDFGNNLALVVLAGLLGATMGVMMGAVISAIAKGRESLKVALNIIVSMVFSFCSGLMVADVKYAVMSSAPILGYLNPANLVADSLYSLYYYTTHERFFLNIGILAAYALVLFLIVYLVMRRQRYESL